MSGAGRYFNLKKKVGSMNTVLAMPNYTDTQAKDIGLFTIDQVDSFVNGNNGTTPMVFVVNRLTDSLALWKEACNLEWRDLLSVRLMEAGEDSHKREKKALDSISMVRSIDAVHTLDQELYMQASRKLEMAFSSHPSPARLNETLAMITLMNKNAQHWFDCRCGNEKKCSGRAGLNNLTGNEDPKKSKALCVYFRVIRARRFQLRADDGVGGGDGARMDGATSLPLIPEMVLIERAFAETCQSPAGCSVPEAQPTRANVDCSGRRDAWRPDGHHGDGDYNSFYYSTHAHDQAPPCSHWAERQTLNNKRQHRARTHRKQFKPVQNSSGLHTACQTKWAQTHCDRTCCVMGHGPAKPPTASSALKRLWLTHVPKTAGYSFMMDLKSHLPANAHLEVRQKERCYRTYRGEGEWDTSVFVLRNPRDHVIAQYMQCKYSKGGPWIQRRDAPRTPLERRLWDRTNGTRGDAAGFKLWVGYFADKNWAPSMGSFDCFNPRNLQTRQLSCTEDARTGSSHLAGTAEPSLTDAIQSLKDVDMLGLLERFNESVCLFLAVAQQSLPPVHWPGTRVPQVPRIQLPPGCRCGGDFGHHRASMKHHHVDHHSMPHSPEAMGLTTDDELAAAVDQLTSLDRLLYQAAVPEYEARARTLNKTVFQLTGSHICTAGQPWDARPLSMQGLRPNDPTSAAL